MGIDFQRNPAPGPLEQFKAGFAEHLLNLGHVPNHVRKLNGLVRELDRWLADEGLGAEDLRKSEIARFQAARLSAGQNALVSSRALKPFTEYLRRAGIEPEETELAATGAVARLLQRYRQHLATERGIKNVTAERYVALVRPFLEANMKTADGVASDLHNLIEADVTAFVVAKCPEMNPGVASLFVTALRSVLAFLHVDGVIDRSMIASVPTVPGRRLTGLPKGVTPNVLDQLFASCDRHTRTGSRCFAVLTLLARLGLRAGELAGLQLDDVNWRSGEVMIVRGKGDRTETLPLPIDVGEALADYLFRWRPSTAVGRTVFVRIQAPHRALTRGGIAQIVAGAAERCGLDPIYAHRLRHTAATQMLRKGASLSEVGQVLRHRQTITTAIYAKVDREALRSIARIWPGDVA